MGLEYPKRIIEYNEHEPPGYISLAVPQFYKEGDKMAIYLRDKDGNRKLVAGSGTAGKGAYEAAVADGYTRTGDEFNAMMANIATKASP